MPFMAVACPFQRQNGPCPARLWAASLITVLPITRSPGILSAAREGYLRRGARGHSGVCILRYGDEYTREIP